MTERLRRLEEAVLSLVSGGAPKVFEASSKPPPYRAAGVQRKHLWEMEGLLRRGRAGRLKAEPPTSAAGTGLTLDESEEEDLGEDGLGSGEQPAGALKPPVVHSHGSQAQAFAAMFRVMEGYQRSSAKGASTLERALDGAGSGSGDRWRRNSSPQGRSRDQRFGAQCGHRGSHGRGFGFSLSEGGGPRASVGESVDRAPLEDFIASHRGVVGLDDRRGPGLLEDRPAAASEGPPCVSIAAAG